MREMIRRNLGWFFSLTTITAISVILLILLFTQQNKYESAQTAYDLRNRELTMQLELQENEITELNDMVQRLNEENSVLENKLYDYDDITHGDVLILDRSLPQDLLDTVFAYYQSIDEKDYETYESLVMNEFMLSLYEDVWKNQNAAPNEGDRIKSVISVVSDAKNSSDLGTPSFVGNIVLMVNKGFTNGELLYLRKENGNWYVWDID